MIDSTSLRKGKLNMKNSSIALLAICFISANAISAEERITYKECNYLSSQLNSNLPKKLDEITTADSTICTHSKNNRIILLYRNTLDLERNELPKKILSKIHETQKNNICTNPNLKSLVDVVDMGYVFNDNSGQYLGEFAVKVEDCTLK
jgi:hypothetical protein